jgi:hypothetical protein
MRILSLSLLCLMLAGGCAHRMSSGGGHVVGNPMMPAEYSSPDGDCGCGQSCACGSGGKGGQCGCGAGKAKK